MKIHPFSQKKDGFHVKKSHGWVKESSNQCFEEISCSKEQNAVGPTCRAMPDFAGPEIGWSVSSDLQRLHIFTSLTHPILNSFGRQSSILS